MDICVITGASSGMGKEFAIQLEKVNHYDEIWLIARREEKLKELSSTLSTKARILPLDLEKEECLDLYKTKLEEEKPNIKTLVNASGYGKFGMFTDIDLKEDYGMINLNVKALTAMTYNSLPFMSEGSEIYELCSLSSFQPVPGINVYGATKAYVLSFSRALNVELKSRKIKVLAVSPGWVKTEFFNRAVTDNTITYYDKYYTPNEVITRAIRDMQKGKDVSVCGFSTRMQVRLVKMLSHKLVMKIWCKQQKIK